MIDVNRPQIRSVLPYILAIGLTIYLTYGGIYYKGAADTVLQTYIYGLFNGGNHAMPDTFGCFAVLTYPLNFLHNQFPSINWYDWFHLTLLLFNLGWLLNFFVLSEKTGNIRWLLIDLLFCATVASEIFQPAELTKTAIFLGAISIIEVYQAKSHLRILVFIALFLISLLMRIESGLLSLAIISPFLLMDAANRGECESWVRKTTWLLLPVIIVSVFVNIPKTPEEKYYLEVRAYEYALTDFERERANVHLENKEDSAIFFACVHFFFADSARCNQAFFKKIGLLPFDKTPGSLIRRLGTLHVQSEKVRSLVTILLDLKWLLLLTCCIWLWMLQYGVPGIRLLLANFFTVFLLCFLSLWLKPEEHVIGPALAILVLLNVRWLKMHYGAFTISPGLKMCLAGASVVCMLGGMYYHIGRMQEQRRVSAYYANVGNYLKANAIENYLLNIGSWDEAHHKMFEENKFAELPNAYVMDGAVLYFNGGYQRLMKKTTGSAKFIDQWNYFVDVSGSTFVSPAERMEIILDYINTIYHKNYRAQCIRHFDSPEMDKKSIGLFVLK